MSAVIVDYHMHMRGPIERGAEPLVLSADTVDRYCAVAARRGIDEIGFTEHVYYFAQTREIWWLPYQKERCRFDLDAYVGAVADAKDRGLPVKLGLEVDFVGPRQQRLAELLAPYPWDFLLGSVHWVDGGEVDFEPGVWARLGVEDAWRGYFRDLCRLARSGTVDVLAHPDLPKIFGRRPGPELEAELHEQAAEALDEGGLAVEISTAGLRKPVAELYPADGLLRACRRRGVPITTASDAHQAELVGEGLDEALGLARRCGYETVSVFEGRGRRQAPLPP